ncbi:unnamed protein product [Allacma fusca]|uniref:Glucose-methanol-choline oxidoreductase C-terminal domain-containing protein n=1 Tax=Allacma fusca TaxID=39272 RepID=A0A8J2NTH9_9HEXA|nr:unnamed protein product [Allacma fusca]
MDFISLALHYLISVIGGASLENLFTQFYSTEESIPVVPVHVSSGHEGLKYHLDIYDFIIDEFHGHYGPLHVETGKDIPLQKEWLAAGAEMGLMLKNPNGFQNEGVFPIDTSTFRGTSISTYWAYLYPVLERPNLRVVTYAHVQKIILDDENKAVAVRAGAYSTVGFETGGLLTSSLATNQNKPDIFLAYHAVTADPTLAISFEKQYGLKPGIMQKYLAAEDRKDSFFADVVLAKPKSTGEIKLTNASPNDPPLIDPNFLNHTDDVKVILEGTWRMGAGPEDPRAVVDSQLRVLGTTGLRVIDSSIMPEITTTSTMSPTIMIAEKGAQMILDYWNNHY